MQDNKQKEKSHFVSFGQRTHQWGTYLSVDWVWNYISGVSFAAWGRYTNWGKSLWSEPATKAATYIARDLFKVSEKGLDKSVGNVVAFMSVIAGGTIFTIPPLMYLEEKKRRRSIVKWLDEKYYGKEAVANDPRFVESYDAMEHEEKKGFWSGQASRFASLAPLLATVMLDKPRDFTQPYFDKIAGWSGKSYNAIGLTKERLFPKRSPAEREVEWKWLHQNSAIDFGLEPWYAVFHMISYKAFSQYNPYEWYKARFGKKADENQTIKVNDASVIASTNAEIPKKKEEPHRPDTKVGHISREQHLASVAQVSKL